MPSRIPQPDADHLVVPHHDVEDAASADAGMGGALAVSDRGDGVQDLQRLPAERTVDRECGHVSVRPRALQALHGSSFRAFRPGLLLHAQYSKHKIIVQGPK